MPSGFRLAKWYLDCITDTGEVFIGYSAKLTWGRVRLNYSAGLWLRDGEIAQKNSWRKASQPIQDDSKITWTLGDVSGVWQPDCPPFQARLLSSPHGDLTWNCLQPRSEVTLRRGKDKEIKGTGYGEFLEMTIPPWSLGIEELRWGRFNNSTDSLVWIDWQGPNPLTLVLHNGNPTISPSVTDTSIHADGLSLEILNPTVLRQGALSNTALTGLPLIRKAIPAGILATQEVKWRGRATFSGRDGHISKGWTIHELVRFT